MTRTPSWSPGSDSTFPNTRLSILDRIRSDEPEVRSEAFGSLVTGYWKPIYKYVRIRWHQHPQDAEDLTQGFLATAFEKHYFDRYDPAKARFRTFLRTCLDRYVSKEQQAARALKRGGAAPVVALDFVAAEGEVQAHVPGDDPDVDAFFRQELVRDLFARTVRYVRDTYRAAGRDVPYRVFERYDLDDTEGLTYAALADELRISVTKVTNYLAAARRSFRARALEELQAICGTDEEFRQEARALFGIEVP